VRRIFPSMALFALACLPRTFAGVSVVGDLTQESTAGRGQSYTGTIVLQNTGDEELEVDLYQTDYRFSADGRNDYGEPGKSPRSNAAWIVFSPRHLSMPARQRAEVSYTVQVPDDASLVGSYWSLLMVEGLPKPVAEAPKSVQPAITLKTVIRYGIQMITNIGDTGTRALQFAATRLLRDGRSRSLQIDVENPGERWLETAFWVELYDGKGALAGRFEAEKQRVFPGTSVRFRFDLSAMPEGTYRCLAVADAGGDNLFGANYTLQMEK
jgi:hypothetical protein